MHATIRLSDTDRFLNLLHGFMAVHNSFSHDSDEISFFHQGKVLTLQCAISYVTYGEESVDRKAHRWTENISFGEIEQLLRRFTRGDWTGLDAYPWLG